MSLGCYQKKVGSDEVITHLRQSPVNDGIEAINFQLLGRIAKPEWRIFSETQMAWVSLHDFQGLNTPDCRTSVWDLSGPTLEASGGCGDWARTSKCKCSPTSSYSHQEIVGTSGRCFGNLAAILMCSKCLWFLCPCYSLLVTEKCVILVS
jgi:hypothetical protein